MNTSKHIDGYGLQYWLYAILNKEFGSEVKFERCSLHARYKVNRHSFTVKTNTLSLTKVKDFLINKLKEGKYFPENERESNFMKKTDLSHGKEMLYVSVDQQNHIGSNEKSLNISAFAYWTKHK